MLCSLATRVRCFLRGRSAAAAAASSCSCFVFTESCMSRAGKNLLNTSQNAHVPLPSSGRRFVGDAPRGVRVSAHLRSQSPLRQALQTRATNLGKRPLHTRAQPLQLICTSSEAKGAVLGLLGRPNSDRSRCTTMASRRVEHKQKKNPRRTTRASHKSRVQPLSITIHYSTHESYLIIPC